LGIITALSTFYVKLYGCDLLDNANGAVSSLLGIADDIGITLLDNTGAYYPDCKTK